MAMPRAAIQRQMNMHSLSNIVLSILILAVVGVVGKLIFIAPASSHIMNIGKSYSMIRDIAERECGGCYRSVVRNTLY